MGTKKIKTKTLEAKGAGATQTGDRTLLISTTVGDGIVIAPTTPQTALDIFNLCITRAKNLIKIHQTAHGKKARPEKYLADAYRAAIVMAVSALDAFIRTFVIGKIRIMLEDRSESLPVALSDQIKKFLKEDKLLEAARKDDLIERVEAAFQNDFEKRSFQGTKNITVCMKYLGYQDIFHEVAISASYNEEKLRGELDEYTSRRHIIAHKGDYNLDENPPKENIVRKIDAQGCIKLVSMIAKYINNL